MSHTHHLHGMEEILFYFDKTDVYPTVNYYVQRLFSLNSGNRYYSNIISFKRTDSTLAASCVTDSSGDVILKMVNAGPEAARAVLNLSPFNNLDKKADIIILKGNAKDKDTKKNPKKVVPQKGIINVKNNMQYEMPAYSLSIIRIRTIN